MLKAPCFVTDACRPLSVKNASTAKGQISAPITSWPYHLSQSISRQRSTSLSEYCKVEYGTTENRNSNGANPRKRAYFLKLSIHIFGVYHVRSAERFRQFNIYQTGPRRRRLFRCLRQCECINSAHRKCAPAAVVKMKWPSLAIFHSYI